MPHNHEPRCCCRTDRPDNVCPSCVEHGELATLGAVCGFRHLIAPDQACTLQPHPVGTPHSWDQPAECTSCHAVGDQPHTEYCKRENREYPGQPGVRPDGRNADLHTTASGDVDLVGALHASIDAARTARRNGVPVPRALLEDSPPSATAVVTNELEQSMKAGHGVSHQAGPWCPNPCAYHGSPDR